MTTERKNGVLEKSMAHYAEELAVQRERQKQLTWKTNIVSSWSSEVDISIFHRGRDFIMACLALTVLLVKVTRLDGISAVAIPYGPSIKTFKVLNLNNQQQSGLREETKVCGLLYGLIFHSLWCSSTLPPPHYILLLT